MQRFGKNHGGYFGETIAIREVLDGMESAAREHGWDIDTFGEQDGYRLLALHRSPPGGGERFPRVYLSAGIHGDEPAGPLAMLRLLRENAWPATIAMFVCPCLNPQGFALNRRENAAGVDLNRDYLSLRSREVTAHVAWLRRQPAFDLGLCLHEDWESHGAYIYELNPDHQPTLAEAMISRMAPVCPIDRSEMIEGRPAQGGIIRPNLDPTTRLEWPESFWLIQNKTRHSYTVEAPSDFPLHDRVSALAAAVNAALAPPS